MKVLCRVMVKRKKYGFLFIALFMICAGASAQSGDQLYMTYCLNCHGDKMQGTAVGSALIKKTWKYGSDKKSILKNISDGIPNTTMIAWSSALSAKELEAVTAYILQAQKPGIKKAKK